MKLNLLEVWRRIRTSFWFLPSLMVSIAMAWAMVNLFVDRLGIGLAKALPPWLAVAGAETARSLLSTIAGSMITVAGVTYSIVIVALTLASSQYGPRLLVGFMQSTTNQAVLGIFISVFMYCLVVLLYLPGEASSRPTPQTSVLTAVLLAIVAVVVLIFFFHHISTSIQAGQLIREASATLKAAVQTYLPPNPAEVEEAWPPRGFSEANAKVQAPRSGYLSTLDPDRLVKIATEHDLRILIEPRAGDFVLQGQTLALVSPADALTRAQADSICNACALVRNRENAEDLTLAVERLTEIAVRSLSPGINDPYTAIATIHQLTASFQQLLDRLPAKMEYVGSDKTVRLFLRPPEGESLLNLAFAPIRTYGQNDGRVLETLMRSLQSLGRRRRQHWHPALLKQMEKVLETARGGIALDKDRERIEACFDRARIDLAS